MKAKDVLDVAVKMGALGSHLHTVGSLLGAIKGGSLPADAGDAVKGFHGAFGHGDEREIQVLLLQLESWAKCEGWTENPRELFEGFMSWHFVGTTSLEKAFAWYARSNFRTFITKMGSAPKKDPKADIFKVETVEVKKTKTKETTTKTVAPFHEDGSNNSLEFLKWMVTTIRSETIREDGYKKLLAALKVGNVPTVPDGFAGILQKFAQEVDIAVKALSTKTTNAVLAQKSQRKGWFTRLITEWKL